MKNPLCSLPLISVFAFAYATASNAQESAGGDSTITFPAGYFAEYTPLTVNDMLDRVPGIDMILNTRGPNTDGDRGLGASANILIDGKRQTEETGHPRKFPEKEETGHPRKFPDRGNRTPKKISRKKWQSIQLPSITIPEDSGSRRNHAPGSLPSDRHTDHTLLPLHLALRSPRLSLRL